MIPCLLLGWLSAAAAMDPPPPPYFEDAALDGSGELWAYSRAEYNHLYRFDGKTWTEQAAPFDKGEHAMPARIVPMPDGAVECVWRLGDKQFAVTRHLSGESRLLGRCEEPISGSGLLVAPLADSQNRLWITGQSARIYRVDAKGVALTREITPEELDKPSRAAAGYNEMHAAEDGLGRVWVWSEARASNWANLRGALIFTGDKAELHELAVSPDKMAKILTIARADDRHMWVAVADDGLYKADIKTLALERQPDPAPKALSRVRELFVCGGDVYAVERGTDDTNALWRHRDGKWQQIVAVFDRHQFAFSARSWLPIDGGLLASAYQGGPWLIPTDGQPAEFSWRTGFPLNSAHSLLRFADGRFFAIGQGGKLFCGPLDLPPREQENPPLTRLDSERRWLLDAANRPWMIFREDPANLREWDGERWIAHEIPGIAAESLPAYLRRQPPDILADAEGRVWVMPIGRKNPLRIFDTHAGQWQVFASHQEAILALRGQPPHFLGDHSAGNPTFDPQYGADGKQIAYREGVSNLWYYDGSNWQQFNRAGIGGQKGGDSTLGPPWFDAAGRLCVNFRGKTTWRRDAAGPWSQIAFESHYPDDAWSEGHRNPPNPTPPAGSVTEEPDSIAVDNLGMTWMTWRGALYRAVPGRCVPVFAPGEPNPFLAGSRVSGVFVDARGNVLLLAAGTMTEVYLLHAKSPPRTTLTAEPVGEDGQRLAWHTEASSPVQFRWRLDDGPWHPTEDTTLTLANLPSGAHQVTVSAQDTQLQTDASPAVARFETRVDPERQVAGLVAQLSDPDYNRRKAAVNGLAQQPERAALALQRAREMVNDDQRWWIDAALQGIEAARRPAPPPGK